MRGRSTALAAVLLLTTGGCYSPGIEPCRYACNDGRCPAGLTCNGEMCALKATDRCDLPADGPADVSIDSACGWSTSNVDPCARGAHLVTANWTITVPTIIDTNGATPSITPGIQNVVPALLAQSNGPEAVLIMVQNLRVDSELTVRGPRPVIILANGTVAITRAIQLEPRGPATVPGCTAVPGGDVPATAIPTAGGGGGGGFGQGNSSLIIGGETGGIGFVSGGVFGTAGAGGAQVGTATLVPLRPGCGGAAGGSHGFAPVAGGPGGGAIQISARTTIALTGAGSIQAPGGHGLNGPSTNGGSGGGAGGAILLEATSIMLGSTSRLCASGAGGGAGDDAAGSISLAEDGHCDSLAAAGGGSAGSNGAGGNGTGRFADPGPGRPGGQSDRGGGGGGGGAGRIRLNGALDAVPGALVVPVASRSP